MALTIVVALGAGTVLRQGQRGSAEEQRENLDATAGPLVELVHAGHRLIITHGNGPQVANRLIQNDETRTFLPAMPMDVCGAESQGQIGYLVQTAVENRLRQAGLAQAVVCLLTRVLVDAADPAFSEPVKPVGPFYTTGKALELLRQGVTLREYDGRGWRRLVPSPPPVAVCEVDAVRTLVSGGAVVIAAGGGGIPVCRAGGGELAGIAAVVEKDLTAARLALDLGADLLLILTDVPRVALDFGRPSQQPLARLTPAQALLHLAAGQFEGGMAPKVRAAAQFAAAGGRAAITDLAGAVQAVGGSAGTQFVP